MTDAPRLNIIGCGMVGTTLGLLLRNHGVVIGDVVNRSPDSTDRAVARLGAGRASTTLADLRPAELTMIATQDDGIAEAAGALAKADILRPGDLAFHCSGATSAEILAPLRTCGARVASLHPLKSFTEPPIDAASFAGTFCALDGDCDAVATLRQLFEPAGAICAEIRSDAKLLYHAGAVFLSNYLHCLTAAALRCYSAAGISGDIAGEALHPLLMATAENTLAKGPAAALTGPIARGDSALVAKQLAALRAEDPTLADLYLALAGPTLALATIKGAADLDALKRLTALLDPKP